MACGVCPAVCSSVIWIILLKLRKQSGYFLVRFNSCIFTSRLALTEVEGKSVSSMVLDMVFDHEGIVNLRLSSSASGSVAGICLIPASALSFSRFILLESGFPVGSLCHLSSCRSWEYPMRSIDPLSKSLFSPLISSMGRRESSMIFSWDTRSFPFNIFSAISGLFRFRSSTARA